MRPLQLASPSTCRARADLKAIHNHIHKDAPINAQCITQQILKKTAALDEFPGTHKTVPEAMSNDLHEVSASAWRIIYHSAITTFTSSPSSINGSGWMKIDYSTDSDFHNNRTQRKG